MEANAQSNQLISSIYLNHKMRTLFFSYRLQPKINMINFSWNSSWNRIVWLHYFWINRYYFSVYFELILLLNFLFIYIIILGSVILLSEFFISYFNEGHIHVMVLVITQLRIDLHFLGLQLQNIYLFIVLL